LDSPRPSLPSKPRLQHYLAHCGVASRRACEGLIRSGAVSVDGVPVTRLGTRLESLSSNVRVHGQTVRPEAAFHILLHKPLGYLCTRRDPHGRKTVYALLEDVPARVYTVGRLDGSSEGLLLVTNDGDLAHALMHPRHAVRKTYQVWLDRPLGAADRHRLLKGVRDAGDRLRAISVDRVEASGRGTAYRWVLGEGRNRQIRRMAAGVDRRVLRLVRTAFGPLELGTLAPGGFRPLTPAELRRLRQAAFSGTDA